MSEQSPQLPPEETQANPVEGMEPGAVLGDPTPAQEAAVDAQFLALATMSPEEASVSKVAELGGMSHAEARDFVDEQGGLGGVRLYARSALKGTDLEGAASDSQASRETAPVAPAPKQNALADVDPDALVKLADMQHKDFSRSAVGELTGMSRKEVDDYLTKAGGLTGVKADAAKQIAADEAALEEAVAPYRDKVRAETLATAAVATPDITPATASRIDVDNEVEVRTAQRLLQIKSKTAPGSDARKMLEDGVRQQITAEVEAEVAAARAVDAAAQKSAEEAHQASQAIAEQAAQEAADQAAEARKAYIRENGGVRKLAEIDARDEKRARIAAWRDDIPMNADGRPTDRQPRGESRGNGVYVDDRMAPRGPETREEWRQRMGVGSGRPEAPVAPAAFTGGAFDTRLPLERDIDARLAAAAAAEEPVAEPVADPVIDSEATPAWGTAPAEDGTGGEAPAARGAEAQGSAASRPAGPGDLDALMASGAVQRPAAAARPERRPGRARRAVALLAASAALAGGLVYAGQRSADEGPERSAASLAQLDRDGRTASPTTAPTTETNDGHSRDEHRESTPATATSSVTSAADPTRINLRQPGDSIWRGLESYGQDMGIDNATRDNPEFMAAVNEATEATLEANDLTKKKARLLQVGDSVKRVLGDQMKRLIRLGNVDTKNMR